MYRLFFDHHILPGEYYRLPEGEKMVIRELYIYRNLEQW